MSIKKTMVKGTMVFFLFPVVALVFATNGTAQHATVVHSDIDLFWSTYDLVVAETDTTKQIQLIDSLYLLQGTRGLILMAQARRYTAPQYVRLINDHPKFWQSIRPATQQAKTVTPALTEGIEQLRGVYPALKPATIYFVVGALRSNGTTTDDAVLIGSELAFGHPEVETNEFDGRTRKWLNNFFGGEPANDIVQLTLHEYVHTQQHPIPNTLLYQCVYEGIAEFISCKVLNVSSPAPAIAYGQQHPEVRATFEQELFHERTSRWLWSNAKNDFGVRDLGYYIGYAIAQRYYTQATNKSLAIQELIELDYTNPTAVDGLIDQTGFFSTPIAELRKADAARRPTVVGLSGLEESQSISPAQTKFTIHFSAPLDGTNYGFRYSDLGRNGFPELVDADWSKDNKSMEVEVELEPETHYKFWITEGFQTKDHLPVLPYLVEFTTRSDDNNQR